MKLGVAVNAFDGHELLRAGLIAIRAQVDYVCVVYQTVSNFGQPARGDLEPTLRALQREGLVHDLYCYTPQEFEPHEKRVVVASTATGFDLGGARAEDVADQFCNELCKREIGRQLCAAHGCTHFMSIDTDEFYDPHQLQHVKEEMVHGDLDVAVCRMRHYYKRPTLELMPRDELNYVAVMYKVDDTMPFRVSAPCPVLLDPTRRLMGARRLKIFARDECEMHHYSMVRKDIRSKLENVSNRGNYDADVDAFVRAFRAWSPPTRPVLAHPYQKTLFIQTQQVKNRFNIDADGWD